MAGQEQEWADIDPGRRNRLRTAGGTELLQACREGDRTTSCFSGRRREAGRPLHLPLSGPEGTEHTFDGVTTSGTAEEVDGREGASSICIIQTVLGSHPDPAGAERRRTMKHLNIPLSFSKDWGRGLSRGPGLLF